MLLVEEIELWFGEHAAIEMTSAPRAKLDLKSERLELIVFILSYLWREISSHLVPTCGHPVLHSHSLSVGAVLGPGLILGTGLALQDVERHPLFMWVSYKEKVSALSEKLVECQRPIRVLDAIKWNTKVEADFFAAGGRELPVVGPEYYANISLGFDPAKKDLELQDLGFLIDRTLGADDDLGRLLMSMVEQYRDVVAMLSARGTKEFYKRSRVLYGSPKDKFFSGAHSIMDQGKALYEILSALENKFLGQEYPKNIGSEEVVAELKSRFSRSFLQGKIHVEMSDGIVADAAAGSDVIKIKQGAFFSRKDIDIFEVHEGWVHVATTLNGKNQKVAKFLSKGSPRVSATQEGLAILMEILTFSTYPLRARAINDRILGIDKAEEGADFLEVYDFYRTEGYSDPDSFRNAMRVFRGGVIAGGSPFTKDISYCRGFIENYNFIRSAIRRGRPEIVPFLFAGKLQVDDIPMLYQKSLEGIVDAPTFLPPQFEDMNGLAVWMSFSNFLNSVDMNAVSKHYDELFRKYL